MKEYGTHFDSHALETLFTGEKTPEDLESAAIIQSVVRGYLMRKIRSTKPEDFSFKSQLKSLNMGMGSAGGYGRSPELANITLLIPPVPNYSGSRTVAEMTKNKQLTPHSHTHSQKEKDLGKMYGSFRGVPLYHKAPSGGNPISHSKDYESD